MNLDPFHSHFIMSALNKLMLFLRSLKLTMTIIGGLMVHGLFIKPKQKLNLNLIKTINLGKNARDKNTKILSKNTKMMKTIKSI